MRKDPLGIAARVLNGPAPFAAERLRWVRASHHDAAMRTAEVVTRRGDVAVDVGAHRGVWTARMLGLVGARGRVHSFEPMPTHLGHLRAIGRPFPRRHHLHPVALSDRAGEMTLTVPHNTGLATLATENNATQGDGERLTVRTARLDDELAGIRRLDVIKIDVEGFEDSVLSGGEALLARFAPTIIIELEHRHRGQPFDDVIKRLQSLGLNGYAVYDDGLRPVDQFDLERDQLRFVEDFMSSKYVNDFVFARPDLDLSPVLAR